ncbi:FtsX-like permease family protein, partial [Thermobifida cellulosilytica]
IGVFLVLGAANSVSVAQFDRRNEFRGMRLLGFTWRQIHRTVTAETVLTVTLAFGVAVLVVLWIAVLTALRSGAAALSLLPQLLPVASVAALGGVALLLSTVGTLGTVRGIRRGR